MITQVITQDPKHVVSDRTHVVGRFNWENEALSLTDKFNLRFGILMTREEPSPGSDAESPRLQTVRVVFIVRGRFLRLVILVVGKARLDFSMLPGI